MFTAAADGYRDEIPPPQAPATAAMAPSTHQESAGLTPARPAGDENEPPPHVPLSRLHWQTLYVNVQRPSGKLLRLGVQP